jgi:opacity protein-like surface antigen
MKMGSLKTFALSVATVAVLGSTNVRAADMPALLPPPIQDFGGWYLRGDIGMSNQTLKRLEHPLFLTATDFQWLDKGGFDSAPFFGIGIGYAHNSWFRWDLTGEYRGKASFHALDRFDNAGTPNTNDYDGMKSEWLFMLNAYIDLGTWRSFTPFIGAGIGASRITISHFTDTNVIGGAGGFAESASTWDLAWAIHAGFAYQVTPNFVIELAYRYLSLGDGKTGDFRNTDPGQGCNVTPPCFPVVFKELASHDIKLGMRWMLADMGVSHWRPSPSATTRY